VHGWSQLKLWRQGPITRFFIGDQEVAAPIFALELSRQHEAQKQVEAETNPLLQPVLVTGTPEVKNADRPAMPRDFFDEYGVHVDAAAGLTKREYAEVYVLAGAVVNPDARSAVDHALLAVSILIDVWAERDSNA
jgi:hypothetical protein